MHSCLDVDALGDVRKLSKTDFRNYRNEQPVSQLAQAGQARPLLEISATVRACA